MMHDYTVMILDRTQREDAARRRAEHDLRRLATAGQRPWYVALAARLLPFRPFARPTQPASEPCYVVPCQPARDTLNL